jgi:hypothetical protein
MQVDEVGDGIQSDVTGCTADRGGVSSLRPGSIDVVTAVSRTGVMSALG